MSDKLETISDIIAKKRRIAKSIRDEASNGDYWDKKKANEEAEEYEWDADDIEAAYNRELGDAQKMREALVEAIGETCAGCARDCDGCLNLKSKWMTKAKSALATRRDNGEE